MSAPFTTPSGVMWQMLLNEITMAYSERRQAIRQAAYVPKERLIQLAAYWADLQDWLETYCTSFIDHANGPLTDAGDEFLYFTLDNWRAAAGIHQNGFRRKYGPKLVEDYGQMQPGDAIGGWIFEDLQRGFGALMWLPFFGNIANVRNVFPAVTGIASYSGSGTGAGFGVWYGPYQNGELLGGSGNYNIVLDNRTVGGLGGAFYISFGRSRPGYANSLDSGVLELDTGMGAGILSFSAQVTFVDSTVQVFGCKLFGGNQSSYSARFSTNSATVSARLDMAIEGVAIFEFFPVIKIPFSNA